MPYEERLKLLKWPSLEQRRLFSSLIECYKTINRLNGLDPLAFFTFAHGFRPLRANHRFKLKLTSATLNSFKHSSFSVVHVNVNIKNNAEKDTTMLLFFF